MRKYSKAVVNLSIAIMIFLAVIFLLPRMLMFFLPFVCGWIIALIAGPLVRFFEEKIRLKRKIGGAFVIVAVIALVVLLIYFVGSMLIQQLVGLIGALPDMWESMEADLSDIADRISQFFDKLPFGINADIEGGTEQVVNYIGELLRKMSTPTIAAAGNFAKLLPGFFIGLIMTLLSSYFFVAERMQLNEWFGKNMPMAIQLRYNMIRNSLIHSVGGYLKAQLKIEIWMYILLVFGLGILGVDYYALIALIIAFLDFIPFLGTGTVLIPWAVIRILTADYKMTVGLLIIWGVGQLARQLIQPKIVGDSMGVPPLPTLFLLYIGYKFGGVVGMIIAVPIGLLAYTMYQEGAFDTTKNSALILLAGINRFRRLGSGDLCEVDEMKQRNGESLRRLMEERREMERKREAERNEKRSRRQKVKNK